MKRVMVLSGGTSTAWHIVKTMCTYFRDEIYLIVCDINPEYLVHTSVYADKYIQVSPINSDNYYDNMLKLIDQNNVDVIVPLIDEDIRIFSSDNEDLLERNVFSSAAKIDVWESLSDKTNLYDTLYNIGVDSPRIIKNVSELVNDEMYLKKASIGCGSRGVEVLRGQDAVKYVGSDKWIVQEMCEKPEITVDVSNYKGEVNTVCRIRDEIKLGVSTKCEVFYNEEIQKILELICKRIELPSAFCVQFMKKNDRWSLIDFNLRTGGGSAISAAVGFDIVRYAVATWLGLTPSDEWLKKPERSRFVVRAYQEIVTK